MPCFPLLQRLICFADDLYDLLVRQKKPVFFVGEADSRSTALALALLRGSFDGVHASSYTHASSGLEHLGIGSGS